MNIKALIPNFFTMLNLLCGCVAVVFVAHREFSFAFSFVCLGIFFDFFDGFFARKLKVSSELGVQLDSLADMVTSGVVPGFTMYKILFLIEQPEYLSIIYEFLYLPLLGFLITLGACYRLAKFNIDTRQTDSFIGLPTPANALFVMSIPVLMQKYSPYGGLFVNDEIKIGLIIVCFLSAYVMNAEIPLFSLKIKNFSFAKYKLQIFFLAVSVLMLIFLQIVAVPLIILLYVLLSVINNIVNKKASV